MKIQTSGPLPPSPVRSRDPTLTTPTGQTTPTHSASRSLSKRLQSLSLKPKHRSHKSASPTPSNEEHQKSHDGSHDQSRDLETELPGGDAMLEVLMRLQCYQECLVAHLQVSIEGGREAQGGNYYSVAFSLCEYTYVGELKASWFQSVR